MKTDEQYCDDSYWLKQVKMGGSLDDVPMEYRTYDVCVAAVKVRHSAILHVPDQHLTRSLIIESLSSVYKSGYEQGLSDGYEKGYNNGYEEGGLTYQLPPSSQMIIAADSNTAIVTE